MKNYDTRIPTDALPQDIPSRLLRAEDSIRNALEVFPDSWHLGNQLKSIRHQAKALLEPTYAEMREKKPELYEYLIQRNGFAAGINLSNDAIEAERSFFGHLDALIERVGLPVVILPQALFCTKTGELKYVYFNAKDEELGNMTIIIDLLNKKSIFCSKEWVDPRRFPVGFDTLVEVPSENRGDIIDYVKANLLEQFKTPKCLTPLESLRPKP